jgi:prepilin-type N-terminal cleavage/methylation domain-containing protein
MYKTTTTRRMKLQKGFTLVEMLVTVGIIMLLAATMIPSIASIMRESSDSQAYNMVVASLSTARARAIKTSANCGVHVQMGTGTLNGSLPDSAYVGVIEEKLVNGARLPNNFVLANDVVLQKIPGNYAFGNVSDATCDNSGFKPAAVANLQDFTSLSVIYGPSGMVLPAYNVNLNNVGSGDNRVWTDSTNIPSVTCMTMFYYPDVARLSNTTDRKNYLDRGGQLLPINSYTGQLFPRN